MTPKKEKANQASVSSETREKENFKQEEVEPNTTERENKMKIRVPSGHDMEGIL